MKSPSTITAEADGRPTEGGNFLVLLGFEEVGALFSAPAGLYPGTKWGESKEQGTL